MYKTIVLGKFLSIASWIHLSEILSFFLEDPCVCELYNLLFFFVGGSTGNVMPYVHVHVDHTQVKLKSYLFT